MPEQPAGTVTFLFTDIEGRRAVGLASGGARSTIPCVRTPLTDPFTVTLTPADLHRQNPWWRGEVGVPVPATHRWLFGRLFTRIHQPLAPILLVRGPRQVGKTTLQAQLILALLAAGVAPRRILRVQFEESSAASDATARAILDVAYWFEENVLGTSLNEAAQHGEPAILFIDEAQNVRDWSSQLKQLVDHSAVQCVVTGSSAFHISQGRDSLAGRIQPFDLGTLRLGEIAAIRGFGDLPPYQPENGWPDWLRADFWDGLAVYGRRHAAVRDMAFAAFSERGAYPRAHAAPDVPWPELAEQLNDTVVQRVIRHDLPAAGGRVPIDTVLLEEVFRLVCRYVGQSPSATHLAREAEARLGSGIRPKEVAQALDLLASSLLVRLIPPLELRLRRQRHAAKLCLCDHTLRAAWLAEDVPLTADDLDARPHLATLAGHLAESAVGYYLASLTGLDVAHLPERPDQPEIDFVLSLGHRRLPVEVKYQRRIDPGKDTQGLVAFLDNPANDAPVGLLVTRSDSHHPSLDPRIVPVTLPDLLAVR